MTAQKAAELNNFEKLYKIDVKKHVEVKERKNKQTGRVIRLSYLSWPYAIAEIKKQDPQANWKFHEPIVYPDGTMMVHCDFTCFGVTHYMWLPVMDYNNNAKANPNAYDINTSMMRCLVKAIAVHGLGLYIYAGEDVPESDNEQQAQQNQQNQQPLNTGIGRSDKDLENDYKAALQSVQVAQSRAELSYPYNYFKGTKYEEKMTTQIKAKCDLEGWEK